ncbi:hypothetical protein GCM10020229_38930 [Kitasatospora albolonga]
MGPRWDRVWERKPIVAKVAGPETSQRPAGGSAAVVWPAVIGVSRPLRTECDRERRRGTGGSGAGGCEWKEGAGRVRSPVAARPGPADGRAVSGRSATALPSPGTRRTGRVPGTVVRV